MGRRTGRGMVHAACVDFEEVKERIGLNDEYEEYAIRIHDYELPFEIGRIYPH